MWIFLDFDGVLRRAGSPPMTFDRECLAAFENALWSLPRSEIVISSSWREVESLAEMRERFSPDIAARVAGSVPFVAEPDEFPRHREVLEFLQRAGVGGEPWIGVDDDPLAYPKTCPVVLTDPAVGFDAAASRKLIDLSKAAGSG
jgi:HAD domain in Swiss Army Knife RNA repair proteins